MSTKSGEPQAAETSDQEGPHPEPSERSIINELSETKRYAERLARLHRFEKAIHQVASKEILFAQTAQCMRALFEVQRASVTLLNASRTSFDIYALDQEIVTSTLVGSTIPLAGTAVGVAIEESRLLNVADISDYPYSDYQSLYRDGMRSIINAPLILGGRAIGTVNMGTSRPQAFDTLDEEIMWRLTESVARGLDHRRLVAEAQRASQESRETIALMERLRHLNDIAQQLNTADSERGALDVLARLLIHVLPFEHGQLVLTGDHDTPRLFILQPGEVRQQRPEELPGHVLDTDFQSIIEAQLFDGDHEIGLLRLRHAGLQGYSEHDRQLLNQTASLLAATIRNLRLIEDAKRAQSAAEASSAAKSTFVANISHEIRTPLNAIIGMTSLLASSELGDEHQRFVDTIRNSSETLLAVVNEVLDFSKIEANKVDLEEQPFELDRCVHDVVELFTTTTQKRVRIKQQLDSGMPNAFVGDVTRLRQVLVNLVGNAIKFTDAGEIRIGVCLDEPADSATPDGAIVLRFTVTDSGIGMTQEQLHKLFKPFVQGDSSMTRRYGGTGLGLVIARHLVKLMGGRIWAESEPQQGSRFHFTVQLQIAPDPAAAVSRRKARDSEPALMLGIKLADQYPLDILVAEDNKVNQLVTLNILKRLGYRADVAADGLEVIGALERQPYEVILMDMQMPHMDGLSATSRIRKKRGQTQCPQIIAVTANATEDDAKACKRVGMNDYLSKPVRIPDLIKALIAAAKRLPAPES